MKPRGDLTVIQEAESEVGDLGHAEGAGASEHEANFDDDLLEDEFIQDFELDRFEQML